MQLDTYYYVHKNEKIDLLLNKFQDLNVENEYGGLSHAIVNYDYDEQWKLKALEMLFKNGVDVNLKGKTTGYSYIHLALYGYDDEKNKTHSYTTEFIIKLINLGKKYGLDANIKDNDGDSIIHAALASEDYEGDIVPLIEALGPDFDLSIVDNSKRNISAALEYYIEEAQQCENKEWEERLIRDRENILLELKGQTKKPENQALSNKLSTSKKQASEKKEQNFQENDIKLSEIKEKAVSADTLKLIDDVLEEISSIPKITSKLDANLIPNLKETKEKIMDIINQIKMVADDNTSIYSSLFFQEYFKKSPKQKDDLSLEYANMNIDKLTALLEKVTKDNESLNDKINNKVSSINTIKLIDGLLKKLSSNSKTTNKLDSQLISNLTKQKEKLESLVDQIKTIFNDNIAICSSPFFQKYLIGYYEPNNDLSIDYANMNIDELTALFEKINEDNANLRNEIVLQTKQIFSENYEMLIELGLDKLLSWDKIIQIQNEAYQDTQIPVPKTIVKRKNAK